MKNILMFVAGVMLLVGLADGLARGHGPAQAGLTDALGGLSADQVTQEGWADALLEALGEPSTKPNMDAVQAWMVQENGDWLSLDAWPQPGTPRNGARFNPLNATQPEPGSHPIAGNTAGVQAYTSWDYGLQATLDTLRAGNHGYPAILAALSKADDSGAVRDAVVKSDWGTKWFAV